LSRNARYVYVLNTPDDRLEVFEIKAGQLISVGETTLGLRPVAPGISDEEHVGVSNHLSDSVSVVDVKNLTEPRVISTLKVGDEPRDLVVAGDQVIVATAHRINPLEVDIGRANLWIFDARDRQVPLHVLTLFGTKVRALAVSPHGQRVYASTFLSGNATSSVHAEEAVNLSYSPDIELSKMKACAAPKAGAIVKFNGQR
jgi:YVTN family beta-propeller protein